MATIKHAPICLIIMDGWGIGDVTDKFNAIQVGNTPVLDELTKKYPNAKLQASGEYVGLPDGQMGNSEVGHMNIGAGRIIYQPLTKITKAIRRRYRQSSSFRRRVALDGTRFTRRRSQPHPAPLRLVATC